MAVAGWRRIALMRHALDSRQLLAFSAVARRESFTLAAKELFLTQSAVSHAIKALEEVVGCLLVDRAGRRVVLTHAGEQFLRHTERILREMEAARSGLDAISGWGHGRLRIGASTTACQHILPRVLREFKVSFPKCSIRIEPGDHGRQIELLHGGQIDLALMLHTGGPDDLRFIPIFRDELRFMVSPQHRWAEEGRAPKAEIPNETLILYNKASHTFRLVADYFREERILLSNYVELGSTDAIKELVKIGVGAGVLAPWVVSDDLKNGLLVSLPLGSRRLRRQWAVAHLKGRRLAQAEEAFVALCGSAAEAMGLRTSDAAA